MKQITDLLLKLNEIEFKSAAELKKYKAKHKMRDTTKVTIGGKDTTAGEALGKGKSKSKSKAEPKSKSKAYEPPKKADGSVDWDAIANDPTNPHSTSPEDVLAKKREDAKSPPATELSFDNVGDYDKNWAGEPENSYSMANAEDIMDEFEAEGLVDGVDFEVNLII